MTPMEYIFDDGVRSRYFKGTTGDCVCRSIAIASGKDYREIYDLLFTTMKESPRNGVNTKTAKFKRLMSSLGFTWVATSGIGSHQAVHFIQGELPEGRMVCVTAKHYVAVVDNQVHDIFDSRVNPFGEYRKIYGYWKYEN